MTTFIDVAWTMFLGSIPFDMAIIAGLVWSAVRDV